MTYKIIIEAPAIFDLRDILRYITNTLKEPVAAKRIYRSIKEQIKSLDQFPFRCKLVADELFAAQGVRRLLVENYSAFYVVDEANQEVHVLRVLSNRREWQRYL